METMTKRGPGRPPLDEESAARREEEILEAAARTFAAHGFPGTDLQTVADAVGVAKGTIYRYFPSKRELFLAAVDLGMKRLKEQIDADISTMEEPLDQVAAAIRSYFAFFDEHPEYIELIVQERAEFRDRKKPTYFEHREANIGRWKDVFRGLIAAGQVRNMPVERITDVMSNLVYGTMFTNYFAGREKSLESQTQDILDIVLRGILSDSERETCEST